MDTHIRTKHGSRLKLFVDGFVQQFERKLDNYKLKFNGENSKSGNTSKVVTVIGSGIGGASALILGAPPGIGATFGGGVAGFFSNLIGEKAHLSKASILVEVTQILKTGDNGQGLRKVLVRSGVSIFHKYEAQFMKDKEIEENETGSIVTLAIGAMERVMNYINERGVFPEDTEPVSEELITKGLILGKSKGYIGQHFPKRELKVWKIEFKTRFYEDPHVIFEWKPNIYYYYSKTPKIDSKGFRFCFDWEGEVEKKSKEWVIEVFHEYILRKEVLLDEANSLFDHINNQRNDPPQTTQAVQGGQEAEGGNPNIGQWASSGTQMEFRRRDGDKINLSFETKPMVNDFTRVAALEVLKERINVGRNFWPHVTVIYGLGGIGKTELAKGYASKYIEEENADALNKYMPERRVLWIDARTRVSMRDSFRRLAKNFLKISTRDGNGEEMELDALQTKVYRKLARKKCLFVFDDVEVDHQRDVTIELRNNPTAFQFLITSRISTEWPNTSELLPLRQLSEAEAISVVSDGLSEKGTHEVLGSADLVRRLHCFPLAIEQAVAFIRYEREMGDFGIPKYLYEFEKKTRKLLESKKFQFVNNYEKTTFTTWQITIDSIKGVGCGGILALEILGEISNLGHEGIRRERFMWDGRRRGDEVRRAVNLLVKHSMINSEHEHQEVLSVHPLVQEVSRLSLNWGMHCDF